MSLAFRFHRGTSLSQPTPGNQDGNAMSMGNMFCQRKQSEDHIISKSTSQFYGATVRRKSTERNIPQAREYPPWP
jgi:hypothetical protein